MQNSPDKITITETKGNNPWLGITALGILILLLVWAIYAIFSEDRSIKTAEKEFTQALNMELCNPISPYRREIEKLHHRTVTIKNAQVTQVKIKTKNGKNNIGKNGANIQTIYFVVETTWDGWIHENGKTTIAVLTAPPNEIIDLKVIQSDAFFTITQQEMDDLTEGVKTTVKAGLMLIPYFL